MSDRESSSVVDQNFVHRVVLRPGEPTESGELQPTRGSRPLSMTAIVGSPEGRLLGSPGDLVVVVGGGIWQKATGLRTRTGWAQLPGGISENFDLFTATGGEVRISTQVDSRDTSRRYATFDIQNLTVPALSTVILADVDTLAIDGRNSQIALLARAVDAADFTSVGAAAVDFVFRRSGGALAVVTSFPGRSSFVPSGVANTFGDDVIPSISALPGSDDLVFFAQNTAGADRTGHITATWMVQQGGVRP